MGTIIIWALLSGIVTGGVWVAIVLLGRQHRLAEQQAGMRLELERRLDELEGIETRLAELEERVDFTERLLPNGGQSKRGVPPPA
jgi:hypothetical protein